LAFWARKIAKLSKKLPPLKHALFIATKW
jgi:hypothetical protein